MMFSFKRLVASVMVGTLALMLTAASAGANPVSPAALELAQSGVVAASEAARGHLATKTVGLDRAIEVLKRNISDKGTNKGLANALAVHLAKAGGTSPSEVNHPGKGLERVAEAYKVMHGNAYGHDKTPGKPPGGPPTP